VVYFSITPTTFPEIVFAHQLAQENYHSNFTYENHNVEIAYVKAGALILTIDNQEFCAEEGSFLILPHDYKFSIRALDKQVHIHYTVNLHACSEITLYTDVAAMPADNNHLFLPVILPPCAQSKELCQRLHSIIDEFHKSEIESKYKCACKAFELLCDISVTGRLIDTIAITRSKSTSQIYCARIKEYIKKNMGQEITLSNLSVFLDRSPNYLNRIFKSENGITIQQYINREKIKKCVELMTAKGLTLTQCCEYIGIKDPNYLSRLFKKHMGVNASQFKLNSVYSTFPLVDKDRL